MAGLIICEAITAKTFTHLYFSPGNKLNGFWNWVRTTTNLSVAIFDAILNFLIMQSSNVILSGLNVFLDHKNLGIDTKIDEFVWIDNELLLFGGFGHHLGRHLEKTFSGAQTLVDLWYVRKYTKS